MAAESGPQGPDVIDDVVVETAQADGLETDSRAPEPEAPEAGAAEPPVPGFYGAAVEEDLCEEPWNFQFFQVVRLLERFGAGRPVGAFENPSDEVARFSCNPALVFPPSEIHTLTWEEGKQPRISVNFMGLIGQLGVLPLPYTEWVNDRIRSKDQTVREFLDLFHHRIISLFYQAWEKYRFPVAFERDHADRFTRYLLSFIGLGTEGLRDRMSVPDQAMVFYTGLLGLQTRSATGLRQVLQDFFGVPVEIEQFVGTWRPISQSDQSRPGDERLYSEQLSLGAVAGDEVWDQQSTVCVIVGPLTLDRYLDFLPIGTAYKPLTDMLEFFLRREVDCELQLILQREETPGILLDYQESPHEPLLGWTTWLKTKPMGRDPADTVLQLQ